MHGYVREKKKKEKLKQNLFVLLSLSLLSLVKSSISLLLKISKL